MGEREEFLAWAHTTLKDAEVAIHNGDASPRRAIWSRNDPVTARPRRDRLDFQVPGDRSTAGPAPPRSTIR